ncbi:MAG: hypothetical protein ABIS35_15140 [Terracoccus sp.]
MEMASYLAGERWSDHPSCTHPVLASMARCVNDCLDDGSRQELSTMIPEVVGLNPQDDRVPAMLVLVAARAAMPVASAERQNVMALAILTAERALAAREGRSDGRISEASRLALTSAPLSAAWARRHLDVAPDIAAMRPSAASTIVALAIDGIARACVADTERRLVQMLRHGIDATSLIAESIEGHGAETVRPADQPVAAVADRHRTFAR